VRLPQYQRTLQKVLDDIPIKDFARFLVISEGSLAEVEYYLILAKDLGYVEGKTIDDFNAKLETVSKMLGSLRRSMGQSHQAPRTKH